MPSWKKAFLCISVGQPGSSASWPGRHPPCQLPVAVCHLGLALNSTVSTVAFQRPACLDHSLTWWALASSDSSKNCLSTARSATPAWPQQARMSPRGRQRNSRVYLPSKVKSGLDWQREALTRKIPFRREQCIHNLLKLSLVLHHLVSPAITPRRSRHRLVALSHGTRVPSLLWATCRKCLSGDNKHHHDGPKFPLKYSCGRLSR